MKKIFIVFALAFVFMSCLDSEAEKKNPIKETNELTYLALGDSYTIGESVHSSLRWPVQLSDSLRKRGIPLNHPRIIARTGWTTGDLLAAMDKRLKEEQFDLVSVLIGVNNQYQGRSIEEYEKELREIFQRAIARSKSGAERVFAVSIPDYGVTPFGAENSETIAKEVAEFNSVFKRVAGEFGVEFYNITPVSKKAKEDKDLTASDELHPSGKMYSLWVQEIADRLAEKLPSEK
ncbi:SGNH/GDSL hydrolase family protein [Salinimicrobium catena]|uniref:SGNH/GDSL hydrolase family protein n=1 Tax=Salinimicrobium catena TaxID=390640 RepID=UPI002FE487D4